MTRTNGSRIERYSQLARTPPCPSHGGHHQRCQDHLTSPPQLVQRDWQVAHALSRHGIDGVGDRRHTDDADFANLFHSEPIAVLPKARGNLGLLFNRIFLVRRAGNRPFFCGKEAEPSLGVGCDMDVWLAHQTVLSLARPLHRPRKLLSPHRIAIRRRTRWQRGKGGLPRGAGKARRDLPTRPERAKVPRALAVVALCIVVAAARSVGDPARANDLRNAAYRYALQTGGWSTD